METEVIEVVVVEEAVGDDNGVTIDALGENDVVDRESVGGNDEDNEEEEDDDMGGEDKDDPETTGDEN
jgi:hypothetical protein